MTAAGRSFFRRWFAIPQTATIDLHIEAIGDPGYLDDVLAALGVTPPLPVCFQPWIDEVKARDQVQADFQTLMDIYLESLTRWVK